MKMKSQEVRKRFLDFFASKGHHIETSAPIVLRDDPTLMFTNAGMNQFKDIFLGLAPARYPRATDTQKCLRVSGKHNDLEEVGVDTYHHTMFEMLGNWSFGDYFKAEAIEWAWELLTRVYGIDPDILYVTVFEGDASEGLEKDTEAYDIWKKYVPESRIVMGNKHDNFWEMGDQGPCGPSSEIHVDLRPEAERRAVPGRDLVNGDNPQVIEIWNLVFMQYNRRADGSLEPLPARCVDTGMGFERLCRTLEGKHSNYDTDIFRPYIQALEAMSGKRYGQDERTDIALRVVADHIRAVAFAIADGQLPSNAGAGYVIRRILRRAVRYGYSFLDLREPFMYRLVEVMDREMGDSFPELRSSRKLIENVVREEELSFLSTLEKGLVRLSQIIAEAQDKVVAGDKAFELYDTYGFPLDLTELLARESGLRVDVEGFEEQMQAQKERARRAAATRVDDWVVISDETGSRFVGYDVLEAPVHIAKYRRVENKKGAFYQLVFPVTPFYAESGGQVGDTGYIEDENGRRIEILATIKENNVPLHIVKRLPEGVGLNSEFRAVVDRERRMATACNHSATHLLHKALWEVLGEHVQQKGSAVGPEGLRFDFSHFSKLTDEQLAEVERRVNRDIADGYVLEENREKAYKEAVAEGVTALFSEKYGERVRTVRFGSSYELCGGTHVDNTLRIRVFKILSEGAIAAGIRRIEAITGEEALRYYRQKEHELEVIRDVFKGNRDLEKAAVAMVTENANLRKEVEGYMRQKVARIKDEIKRSMQSIGDCNYISGTVELDPVFVKSLIFELGNEIPHSFIVLGNRENSYKAGLSVFISDDLAKEHGWHAGNIVRELARCIGGGGGGQATYAMAGGKNPDGLVEALARAEDFVRK